MKPPLVQRGLERRSRFCSFKGQTYNHESGLIGLTKGDCVLRWREPWVLGVPQRVVEGCWGVLCGVINKSRRVLSRPLCAVFRSKLLFAINKNIEYPGATPFVSRTGRGFGSKTWYDAGSRPITRSAVRSMCTETRRDEVLSAVEEGTEWWSRESGVARGRAGIYEAGKCRSGATAAFGTDRTTSSVAVAEESPQLHTWVSGSYWHFGN